MTKEQIYKVGGFVRDFQALAESVEAKTRIPWKLVLAQSALETGWGACAPFNNYFGIKSDDGAPLQTKEFLHGKMTACKGRFAKYDSETDCFMDYVRVINLPRYSRAKDARTIKECINAIKECGYATDPHYVTKVMGCYNMIDKYIDHLNSTFEI